MQTSAQEHRLGLPGFCTGTETELHPYPHPLVSTPLRKPHPPSRRCKPQGDEEQMPGACSELAIPHDNPMFLDMDSTTRGPSSPGAAARSWVLGQVFPSPAVIQSFILATGKFLQLFPCFMSPGLSAASLAPVLGQRAERRGGQGAPGDTWAAGTCGLSTAPSTTSPHCSPDPAHPTLPPGWMGLTCRRRRRRTARQWESHVGTRVLLPLCSPTGFGPPLPWGSVGEGSSPLSKQSQS